MTASLHKPPALYLSGGSTNFLGSHYVVVVDHPGYAQGYLSVVEDIYERCFRVNKNHEVQDRWRFLKRVQRFWRADHGGDKCAECEAWWEKFPDMPEAILIDGENLRWQKS